MAHLFESAMISHHTITII